MKNMSMWVLVLVLALVGSAIWYEVQYRSAAKADTNSPARRTSTQKPAHQKPAQHPTSPTGPGGVLIG